MLIAVTRHGLVCANAGIDQSNASVEGELVLLPEDPDASARRLRDGIGRARGVRPAVVVADSFGRRGGWVRPTWPSASPAWSRSRNGADGATRSGGSCGSRASRSPTRARADLARAKDSRQPAVLVRGLERYVSAEDGPGAAALRRPAERDLFR